MCLVCTQVAENQVEDLAVVQEDVALKLSLWNCSAEFENVTSGWRGAHFESLDLAQIEEIVTRWVDFAVSL